MNTVSQPEAYSFRTSNSGMPVIQGIALVSVRMLPDRFRSIFHYPNFNAVQSKCFNTVYETDDNFVLSSPTASGKTAVLELAVCRVIGAFNLGSFKIVYQAPTKSLCSERRRDWDAKFGPLGLQCAELTGDTDASHLYSVQSASIIITTPEKWDSMTRKWKDHRRLMSMVKLFLVDEVHILKEDRGATLEAVVSRMKSVGSSVRFIALSATIPNSDDIAKWLGRNHIDNDSPAVCEVFGEEFRPVVLQKYVRGYQVNGNDFVFDKALNAKLPDVITQYSQQKPIMVFCFTRASCVETAKFLAGWWSSKGLYHKPWHLSPERINVTDRYLRETVACGASFHHAGLSPEDRFAVEKGYTEGKINVICCTSTLAVGVNLPCHMVIVKNTVAYQSISAGGLKEYSDLEIMQMLGRAGRPQFDDTAVAVIMTRTHREQFYRLMVNGQEALESSLHCNLIDHLNAEIGLGTIVDAMSARRWLASTFLYVRMKRNPGHYQLEGGVPDKTLDDRLDHICNEGISALRECGLVQGVTKVECTEFGYAMARYYLQFDTMKRFLELPPKAKLSELLSAISQAAEFNEVRFRAGEKAVYKALNANGSIKFPIPVSLELPAHKVSLIVQAVLGVVELPSEESKFRVEFAGSKSFIMHQAPRLIRCMIDCQLYLKDSVAARNALILARSVSAQVWDDSPLHMKQLETVGLVTVRKLAAVGIKTIEDIESVEAHLIERALTRSPPYGAQLQSKARAFPRLRVALTMASGAFVKREDYVSARINAEMGFINDKVPDLFNRRPVYVCLLAETSDGKVVHFARTSAKKLGSGENITFDAALVNDNQMIRAYIMCDEIAGTLRYASLKPDIPSAAFPTPKVAEASVHANVRQSSSEIDSAEDFADIDRLQDAKQVAHEPFSKRQRITEVPRTEESWVPTQLDNGKWACNHACKDKNTCKHLCCREGLDRKPKPPKARDIKKIVEPNIDPKQKQLSLSSQK
ncbi:P-loop containing nucleoside triphosphate hydrolase protein, partial [Polychaeton citri CBS 116435]